MRVAHMPEPPSEGRATTTLTTGADAQLGSGITLYFALAGLEIFPMRQIPANLRHA